MAEIAMRQRQVVDYLRNNPDDKCSAEQLRQRVGVAIDDKLLDLLRKNARVIFDPAANLYSFKPTYEVKGKDDILRLLDKMPAGVSVAILSESYSAALEHIEALVSEGKAIRLGQTDGKQRGRKKPQLGVVFRALDQLTVPSDVRDMFKAVRLPESRDMEIEMRQMKLRVVTRTVQKVKQQGANQTGQKRRRNRKSKLTNTHILTQEHINASAGSHTLGTSRYDGA